MQNWSHLSPCVLQPQGKTRSSLAFSGMPCLTLQPLPVIAINDPAAPLVDKGIAGSDRYFVQALPISLYGDKGDNPAVLIPVLRNNIDTPIACRP
jgi:hypothetical protein